MGINAVTTKPARAASLGRRSQTRSIGPRPQPGLPGPSVLQALPGLKSSSPVSVWLPRGLGQTRGRLRRAGRSSVPVPAGKPRVSGEATRAGPTRVPWAASPRIPCVLAWAASPRIRVCWPDPTSRWAGADLGRLSPMGTRKRKKTDFIPYRDSVLTGSSGKT